MRLPFHLRQARLRHLLSDEQPGRDEVRDQKQRERMRGAQGRLAVRRGARELL